jgi:hypothetical protein
LTDIKRSPLKDKPLRNPGQSLDQERFDRVYDRVLTPFSIAAFLVVLAGLEWWRYYLPHPPNPVLYSLFAFIGVGYAAWRFWRERPHIRALRLGSEGEKAVGQYLERLREQGYQVFHDVLGPGFNVDHVLIGPSGAFTVETKTHSKPIRGDARVAFDGEKLLVDGFEPDRDPIVQAKAQAAWLRTLLAESTGRQFAVRPVILFPGWFVEQRKGTTREVWVLEPKALPDFLGHEATVLNPEDVKLASYHLSRFIRAEELSRARR